MRRGREGERGVLEGSRETVHDCESEQGMCVSEGEHKHAFVKMLERVKVRECGNA